MLDEKEFNFKDQGAIVFHAGGNDPRRAWPENKWIKLAEILSKNHEIAIVKTPETAILIERMKEKEFRVEIFDGDLVQFKNWLRNQKMLIGNDSMPGHLAAYLGIPTISIFGSQDPKMTCPIGKWITIIKPDESCEHKRDHWRLCQKCMGTIDVERVSGAVIKLLSRVQAGI
jgi:ADP-heptose:LPS heptosyltransferase